MSANLARELRAAPGALNIAAFLRRFEGDVRLKVSPNGSVMLRCPFHDDRIASLSFTIGPRDGTPRYRCFGCDEAGDFITYFAKRLGLPLRGPEFRSSTLVEFGRLVGVDVESRAAPRPPAPPPVHRSKVARDAPAIDPDAYDALARKLLDACPIGLQHDVSAYLRARCIEGDAMAVGIGALPVPSQQGPLFTELEKEFGAALLDAAGLRGARGGFAWPMHRLLIPWRSARGRIRVLQRRAVGRAGEPRYVFPRGMQPRAPFGVDELAKMSPPPPKILLTEGALDALAMRRLCRLGTLREPVAVLALPSASTAWAERWNRCIEGRSVVVAFDADDAGDAAAERLVCAVRSAARSVSRWRPKAGDVNDALTARMAG